MSDKIENSDTSFLLEPLETFAADKKVETPAVDFTLPDSFIESVSNSNETPTTDFTVPSSIPNDIVVETEVTSSVPKDTVTNSTAIETKSAVEVASKTVANNATVEKTPPVDVTSTDTSSDNITIEETKPQISIEQTGDPFADTYKYAEAQINANKTKGPLDDQINAINEIGKKQIEANKPSDPLAESKAAFAKIANNNITILDDDTNQEVSVNTPAVQEEIETPSVEAEKDLENSTVSTSAIDTSGSSLPNSTNPKNTSNNVAIANGIKGISAGIVGGLTLAATKIANKVISDNKDSVAQSAQNLKSLSLDTKTQESKYNNMVSLLENFSSAHDGFLLKLDFDTLGDKIRKYFDRYNAFVLAVETRNSNLIQADEDGSPDGNNSIGETKSLSSLEQEWEKAIDDSVSSNNSSDGPSTATTIIAGASSSIGGGGTSSSSNSSSKSGSKKKTKKKKKNKNSNSNAEDSEELVDESEDIENEKIDDEPVDAEEIFGKLDDTPTGDDTQKEVPDIQNNDTSKTPDTSTPSDNQNTTPQETPSDNSTTPTPSHSLNQQGTASSGSDNYHSGGGYSSSDGYSDTVSTSPEGTDGITDVTESPIEVLDDAPTSIEDVIKDNYTKIPSSSEPITSSTSKGKGTIIPVIAGLSAAAAAGIGAKAYLDRKQNNENEEVEELETDDWSGEEKLDLEYDDNKVPVAYLDDDDDEEEDTIEEQQPERYDAKTNEELADLQ